jgi:heme exporter protein D
MNEFLAQGGYAFYVWMSFGVTAAGLTVIVASTLAGYQKAKRALANLDHKEQAVLQLSETNI